MNQKQRFEAEYFRQNGVHIDPHNHQAAGGLLLAQHFAWFCLGEASGLGRAAKVCDTEDSVHSLNGREKYAGVAEYCAEQIRALMAQGEI